MKKNLLFIMCIIALFTILVLFIPYLYSLELESEKVFKSSQQNQDIDLTGMVEIPGGLYWRGSERTGTDSPRNQIKVDDFYMSQYEVTNSEYVDFLNEVGNLKVYGFPYYELTDINALIYLEDDTYKVQSGYEDYPVVEVTWYGADAYTKWKGGRLPTEAEWEYAATYSGKYRFSWGNEWDNNKSNNWEADIEVLNSPVDFVDGRGIVSVGQYEPNKFGLYDMTGNVKEWCLDWYDPDYYYNADENNPTGPEEGVYKIARGGSWVSGKLYLYASKRDFDLPSFGLFDFGFRVVVPADWVGEEFEDIEEEEEEEEIEEPVITDCKLKFGDDIVKIPGGDFVMGGPENYGDEAYKHNVYVSPFYMDKSEVTNKDFVEFLNGNFAFKLKTAKKYYKFNSPYSLIKYNDGLYAVGEGYDDYPVVNVSWYGANVYAKSLGKRLPTESEWEFAASIGGTYEYPWGDEWDSSKSNNNELADELLIEKMAHFYGNRGILPVESFEANEFGLYDMAGNVSEWVADFYNPEFYSMSPEKDPVGPNNGIYKVKRGGSWENGNEIQKAFWRDWTLPDIMLNDTGFRLVCVDEIENETSDDETSDDETSDDESSEDDGD